MNLANKYRPKTFEDVTEQGVVTEILRKLCNSEDLQLRNFLLIGPAGTGKAQPMFSKVLTTTGYITMKDVKVGTEVFTGGGNRGVVSEIYPQGKREIYTIHLDDDTSICVADNHLNVVDIAGRGLQVVTTDKLIELVKFNTVSIPPIEPIQFDYEYTPVDPYLLGYLITSPRCASEDEDTILLTDIPDDRLQHVIDKLEDASLSFTCLYARDRNIIEVEVRRDCALKIHGLPIEKFHIPLSYMYNSSIVRSELLKGIQDSLSMRHENLVFNIIHTVDKQFSQDLTGLIRSLGLWCKVREVNGVYQHLLKVRSDYDNESQKRRIMFIEHVGEHECQCIMIDHPDHTYITDNFTLTHNTTSARIMANILNDGKGEPIEIDAASHSGVNDVREIVEQAQTYPIGSKYKVFIVDECHAITNTGWQSFLACLEASPARSIFVFCLTGDGLVSTSNGLKRLDAVEVGDSVWDGEQFRTVNNVFDNGDRPCLTITLQDGSHIDCTDNHNLEVLEGDAIVWKEARNLKEGDCLLSYSNCPISSDSAVKLSSAECWMLGYITGNGNYTSHSLDIYTPYHKWNTVKTYLDELVAQHVFKDYIIDSDPRACDNNIHDTRIHFFSDKYHPGMTNWYERAGLNSNYTRGTKSLPQAIFSQSADNIRAFIDGWYFADGDGRCNSFFDSSNESPFLYCSNRSMILELQQLLKSIGEYCTVHVHETVITPEYYEKNSFIKPGSYTSYILYRRFRPGYFDNESFRKILLDKYSTMPRGKYKLDLSHLKNPVRRISPKMITEAGYDYSSKGVFIPIKSIEPCGVKHVYDIEVEGSHKFVYNSFVVHNCTTNPEKIPETILSRVQTFQLSKISLKGIQDRLMHIIECENAEGRNITYDINAVNFIAKLAQGGMRNAITLLDKALAYSEDITIGNIEKSLNLPNYDDYFKLLNYLAKKDNTGIVAVINEVYDSGVNFVKWFDGFMAFISNIIKYIYIKDIHATMIPEHYQDKIAGYGTAHAALCLKLSNKLVKLNQELRTTQYLQELAITYLCSTPTPTKGGQQ